MLISMAETIAESLKQYEDLHNEGKFVMMLLWPITETKEHILGMNTYYAKMVDFLEDVAKSADKMLLFIKGQYCPFPERLIENGKTSPRPCNA